ncbi:MAG TPA: hypothetical protein VF665_09535 [Longimicrobium sp.]|jgi:hypothetical protein|uniref:hypothetical protein n=1 Tax=Longimicrobium sp. TaxID=2029185 RepID=UPI002ED94A30
MTRTLAAAAVALMAAACRDRAADKPAAPPPDLGTVPRNVEMRLYVARDWAWNEDDTLRVTVVNGTLQPLSGATLHLTIAAGVQLRDSATEAAEAFAASRGFQPAAARRATADTTVRFTVGTLAPGQSAEFAQAVRTPPAPRGTPAAPADTASRFAIMARLLAGDGKELAAGRDTIRIRAGSAVVTGGCGGIRDVAVSRYGIGPVRLGMKPADVRTLCPEARDTAWRGAEGMTERGLAVSLAGNPVTLVLASGVIDRIVVDTAGLRTGAGLQVGATVADLRARYGRLCADPGEGAVAVWTPAAPGISFALDTAATAPWTAANLPADSLPDAARVTSMWVRKGADSCPAPEAR